MTKLGPLVSLTQRERVLGFVQRAAACPSDVTILCGGNIPQLPSEICEGYYLQPTVIRVTNPQAEVWQEEVRACRVIEYTRTLSNIPLDLRARTVHDAFHFRGRGHPAR
jgi:hypothetical protein